MPTSVSPINAFNVVDGNLISAEAQSFGYFQVSGSGNNLYYKIQIEDAAAFNGGTTPNGKWTYVTAPDSEGRQTGFQGSGYYVYGLNTNTGFNNAVSSEVLEFEIEVPAALVGQAMTFRVRASRDGLAASDQQNDAWVNVIHQDGTGSVEEFLVQTANEAEPVNGDFIKIFGGPNNGSWGYAVQVDGAPNNFPLQIAFPEAGRYVLQVAGRSQGFHIDFIELFAGSLGVNATNSVFVPVGPQPVQLVNEIPDQVLTDGATDIFDLPTGTFFDPDGGPITYAVAVTATNGADVSGVTIDETTGQISGLSTLAADTYQVTVTATDADGTAADTFAIEVVADGLPDAVDDTFATDEDVLISDNVLANDTDPDDDPLTITEVNGIADSVGTQITLTSGALLTLNADGTFIYDPNGQFDALDGTETDSDNFSYTLSDGNGGTDTATVNITINGIDSVAENGLPDAVDDAFVTNRDTVISDDVLANDTDLDGDPLTITEVNGIADSVGNPVTLTSGALLTLNADGTFTYDPNGQFEDLISGETASDSFSYTVSDGNGGTDTATVDITIEASDILPVQPPEVVPFISFESLVTVATAQGFAIPYTPVAVGGLNLGQFFDSGYYLNQNPDVFAAILDGSFTTPFEHFVQFGWLEGRNGSILFSEQEYLNTYGDVAAAVGQGDFRSGFQHFALFGHLEDRDPSSLFSQSDYLTNNPDVKAAVDRGDFGSGFEHYVEFGALEGREPELSLYQEDFYLANNLDVKAAVEQGGFASGFEHFARFGVTENRQPSALYNESEYLAANPDVNNAVATGQLPSGLVHYAIFGAAEGRALA